MKRPLLLFISIILQLSCNTTEPPPPEKTITLKLEDASSIEAWINLTTSNLQLPTTITLKQNTQTRSTINLLNSDTLIYLDSLLPNQQYNFQAITQSSNQSIISNELSIVTMDTTSHDINWEVNTIGDAGSYALDVAIINENNIWVVGKFYKVGIDTAFNAAQWDGNNWNIIYIPIKTFSGRLSRAPIRAIHQVDNEIWVFGESGGYSKLKDGDWQTEYVEQRQGTVNKIWGSSPDNLYFVGTDGSITKFNGSNFSLMNSTTDITLTDIYGTPDGSEVWACGRETGQRSIILRLRENVWERIWEKDIYNPNYIYNNASVKTIWLDNRSFAWFTGAALGVYRQSYKYNYFIAHSVFNNQNAFHRVRGSSSNNIIAVGDDAMIWHFNGSSWHWYDTLFNEESVLLSVDVKNNLIVAIGSRTANILTNALVLVGRN